MNSGEQVNYFEVLGLKIEDIESLDEVTISQRVNEAFQKSYKLVKVAPNNPRFTGKTREDWQTLFAKARETLLDSSKRRAHIDQLKAPPPPAPDSSSTPPPSPDSSSETPEQEPANTSDQPGPETLALAIRNDDDAGVEALIKGGADVNMKDTHDATLLHYAAETNAFKVARVLLDYGADISAKDIRDHTPLQVAVENNASFTERVLRQHMQARVFGYLYKTSRAYEEDALPFQQISWQPTIMLWLIRSWLSGFVLIIITGSLAMWASHPLNLLFMGLLVWGMSSFKWGKPVAILSALCACLGDPILYMLNKMLNKKPPSGKLKIFNCFGYMQKPFNLVQFIVVLKEE